MQRSKNVITPQKAKPKALSPSPLLKKTPKQKQKYNPYSPRSQRIHTLETKPSPHKKNRNNSDLQSPIRIPLASHAPKDKGYETPKFKCQTEQANTQKLVNVQNFFSFGTKEMEKGRLRGIRDKQNQVPSRRVGKDVRAR